MKTVCLVCWFQYAVWPVAASVMTDHPSLLQDTAKVAEIVHNAIKAKLGKPDMYITVNVVKSECVMVNKQKASAVVKVDSIGGSLGPLCAEIAQGFSKLGCDPSKLVMTFRKFERCFFSLFFPFFFVLLPLLEWQRMEGELYRFFFCRSVDGKEFAMNGRTIF